jgi:hypothetical protein
MRSIFSLRNVVIGLVAFLFLATVGLWIESHRTSYKLQHCSYVVQRTAEHHLRVTGGTTSGLAIEKGGVHIFTAEVPDPLPFTSDVPINQWYLQRRKAQAYPLVTSNGTAPNLGFRYDYFPRSQYGYGWDVIFPFRALAFLLGIVLIILCRKPFRQWQARKRAEASMCPYCGYDVRACRDRCAECGRPILT